jgi:hypothetical protein
LYFPFRGRSVRDARSLASNTHRLIKAPRTTSLGEAGGPVASDERLHIGIAF